MARIIPINPSINRKWQHAGIEPALADVLADPLVHLVMRRDGVSLAELRGVLRAGASGARGLSLSLCRVMAKS